MKKLLTLTAAILIATPSFASGPTEPRIEPEPTPPKLWQKCPRGTDKWPGGTYRIDRDPEIYCSHDEDNKRPEPKKEPPKEKPCSMLHLGHQVAKGGGDKPEKDCA